LLIRVEHAVRGAGLALVTLVLCPITSCSWRGGTPRLVGYRPRGPFVTLTLETVSALGVRV
jgi:hypothetical protein